MANDGKYNWGTILGGIAAIIVALTGVVTLFIQLHPTPPPPPPPGVMGALMTNTNLLGNDISHGEVSANAEECQTRCSLNTSCLAMTYEIVSNTKGRCWQKNAVPTPSYNNRSISSIKLK